MRTRTGRKEDGGVGKQVRDKQGKNDQEEGEGEGGLPEEMHSIF